VLAAANRFPAIRRVMAVEGDRDALNRARGVVDDLEEPPIFFASQSLPGLQFADGVFDAAICVSGVATTAQLLNTVSELRRVVRVGGHVLVAALGEGSFPLLESLAREATWAARGHDWDGADIDLARVGDAAFDVAAARCAARVVARGSQTDRVSFGNASSVLADSTVSRDVLGAWRALIPDAAAAIDRLPEWLEAWFARTELVDSICVRWALMEVLEEESSQIEDEDVLDEDSEDDAVEVGDDDVIAIDTEDDALELLDDMER
jgi:SAM-dependent methyltransferase